MVKPYLLSVKEVLEYFSSNAVQGLTSHEVRLRIKKYGPNKLPEPPQKGWLRIFFSQFTSPLMYLLLAAALLIFFLSDDPRDAAIISGILLFNSFIGTLQEGRTARILRGLHFFFEKSCVVIRNGEQKLIPVEELVPGDIIILQEGQYVPADVRILEAYHIKIDESSLTGESEPISKITEQLAREVPLVERRNMAYSGTWILEGWARAVVVATGTDTQTGKIHESLYSMEAEVPLAAQMQLLSWWIILFIFILCLLLFGVGLWMGQPVTELLVVLTALFICVVPEGLPVVLTLVLLSGVYRMAKRHVLVKKMQAVEGLGHANVIVIDKTGTVTRNEMTVTYVFSDKKEYKVTGRGYYAEGELFYHNKPVSIAKESTLGELAVACGLLNTATITFISERGTFEIKGDSTEAALYVFAQKLGFTPEIEADYKKLYEIPFNSQHGYHASFYEYKGKGLALLLGYPEMLFKRLSGANPEYEKMLEAFLAHGLRVVAGAKKEFDLTLINDASFSYAAILEEDLIFLGLCGMEDAVRSEVAQTVKQARNAGLRIIMATGDHQRTAISIASQVGIFGPGDEAIDGPALERISDAELQHAVLDTTVFSRVDPHQKLRIIKALHAHNLIVAMTGDGVNDAPALAAADIGIAMGKAGTEVAQEASDIILLDDSFANIISAIKEGRHILYTLRRVILYFFSTNLAEVLIIIGAFFMHIEGAQRCIFPLTAAQILWLNLISDGFLDSALAMEPYEQGLLTDQRWLNRKKMNLIDSLMGLKMLWAAIPMAIGCLWMFTVYAPLSMPLARSMTLTTLVLFQWFNAWSCRSENRSVFGLSWKGNLWLLLASVAVFGSQFFLLTISVLQKIFGTTSLNIYQWLFCFLVASSILWIEEIRKAILRYARG